MKISKGVENLYQQISSVDWPLIVIVLISILICVVLAGLWVTFKEKNKKFLRVSAVGLVLTIVVFPFVNPAFEKDDQNKKAMQSNILTKYNDKYSSIPFPYLKNVEYGGKGGKYESGRYFTLTYGDDSTEKVKFLFSDKTGEPRCFCDLKQPKNFVMTPEIKEHLKLANRSPNSPMKR